MWNYFGSLSSFSKNSLTTTGFTSIMCSVAGKIFDDGFKRTGDEKIEKTIEKSEYDIIKTQLETKWVMEVFQSCAGHKFIGITNKKYV